MAKVYSVEIAFEDLILSVCPLQFYSIYCFFILFSQAAGWAANTNKVFVFRQLLRYGAASLDNLAFAQVMPQCPGQAAGIKAKVLIKARILNCNKCLQQVR